MRPGSAGRALAAVLLAAALLPALVLLPAAPVAAQTGPSTEGTGTEGMTHVANLQYELRHGQDVQEGTDIEFVKVGGVEYALAGSYGNGMQIVDVTDPSAPTIAAVYDCNLLQGDIQVFDQGDRILATYTADSSVDAGSRCVDDTGAAGKLGTFLVDLTDPRDPQTVSFIEVERGSHNMTVHPGGDYLYNSNSDLLDSTDPHIEIFDISNAEAPEKVLDFSIPYGSNPAGLSSESHDITFNADGDRAYAAAGDQTLVLDTTDPAAPAELSKIVDYSINFVHQSDPVTLPRADGTERELLIITDEQNGAAPNGNCPGGGLHVYDVTGELELAPEKLGTWYIDDVRPQDQGACTSHVLRMYPEQGLMTIAWYITGVHVLDITGLAEVEGSEASMAFGDGVGLREIGQFQFPDSDTWSHKTNRISADGSFFGYANDLVRGFDVFRFAGDGREVPPLEPVDLRPPEEPDPEPSDPPDPTVPDPEDPQPGEPDPDDADPDDPQPDPPGSTGVRRLAGDGRAETAAEVSRDAFVAGVPVAFVATGEDFADALAGGPAAGIAGGPVLLAGRDDLPDATAAELRRLDPARVVVLGGPQALSEATAAAVTEAAGVTAERVAGEDRFATAAAVSQAFPPAGEPVVYVANGGAFPDALSAGPAAGAAGGALLLVGQDDVPEATDQALRSLEPSRIVVLGGEQVVSAQTEDRLGAYGAAVERVAGAERYATSATLAQESFAEADMVYVASGERFPDALAGVPPATRAPGPVLLVEPDEIPEATAEQLERLSPDEITVLGGPAAVSAGVQADLARFVEGGSPGGESSEREPSRAGFPAEAATTAAAGTRWQTVPLNQGTWATPTEALARAQSIVPDADADARPYCLLPRG